MATATQFTQASPFAIFRNRAFALLWSGELISTIGSALTSLASGILIYRLTNSALSVGLMLIATALPSILVGLIAGVFVDRFDRKAILIVSDLLRVVLVGAIPFLVPHNIYWLYVIVFISSAIGRFYDPAHESVLPEIASDQELASANSLMAISGFGATAVGFAAAGFLASAASINWAFYVDAFTFVFSAVCVFLIRIQPLQDNGVSSVSTVFRNLGAGVKYLFTNPSLRSLYVIFLPTFFSFGLWNSLLLPFARRALNATDFQYGLQETVTSVGFVVASLLLTNYASRWRDGQWIVVSCFGMGLVGALYSVSRAVPVALVLVTLSGFLNAPLGISRRTVIQRNTTRDIRGRVFSAFFVSRDSVLLIGMAAAGLADLINVRTLVFSSAVILLISGALALILPGFGQPAEEWKRSITLLKGARFAPGMGIGRPTTPADFDLLISRLPILSSIDAKERLVLTTRTLVADAPSGTTIIRRGEKNDAAYFILEGRAVAGREEKGTYRPLEVLNAGDFFGEIAALTGMPRTADVVADQPTTILQVPATTLRRMMENPIINQIFLNKMTERMVRMEMIDLPRFVGLDQRSLLELRTVQPEAEPETPAQSV